MTRTPLRPADLDRVRLTDGFWAAWQRTNREVTIPYVLDKCDETNRTASVGLEWKPGADWQPHPFYDSDLAKALEAAACSLQVQPDPDLEVRLERYAALFARAQQPDGYLNSYYTQTGLEKRWTNLRDMHELYCAGHLFEAAVVHHRATGSRTLLDAAVRYADHIDATFGPADAPADPGAGGAAGAGGPAKLRGYPGHEEIELALVKLAEATGEGRYVDLARFFIDERGREPHYFRAEAERRDGEEAARRWERGDWPAPYAVFQAHLPVREQVHAEGHSVRAGYLGAGMADVARATGDAGLLTACRNLFDSIAERRMYITGGIGSHTHGERFTHDHDLPNESAYAETCAAIALVFFASRMANAELDGRYGDVMERALYNGVLGGLSLSGDRFFYANPLSCHPTAARLPHVRSDAERQPWYGCACCPPNVARLLASLGSYLFSVGTGPSGGDGDAPHGPTVAVHLYSASTLTFDAGGAEVTLRVRTDYPWESDVVLAVDSPSPVEFTLALRIPGWAEGWALEGPEGEVLAADRGGPAGAGCAVERGYARVTRRWIPGDAVRLTLPLAVRRTYAGDAVRDNGWKVALERGPIVYCLEEVDNGSNLAQLAIPSDAPLVAEHRGDLLGGCTVVRGTAVRRQAGDGDCLYCGHLTRTEVPFTAVPFALRNNRGPGEMSVWMAETR